MNYLSEFFEKNAGELKNRISTEKYVYFLNILSKSAKVNPISAATAESSLCHSEMVMLFTAVDYNISTGKNISVAQAANLMGVSMPAASRTLRALCEKEYVERALDKDDRRSIQISVTKKGHNMIDDCTGKFFSTVNQALLEFSDSDIEKMIDLFGKFISAASNVRNKEIENNKET